MARSQEVAKLHKILEVAITNNDGKAVLRTYYWIQEELQNPSHKKAIKAHLRQLQRQAKGAFYLVDQLVEQRLINLNEFMEAASELLAIEPLKRDDLVPVQQALKRSYSCLQSLRNPRYGNFLPVPDFIQHKEAELQSLDQRLVERFRTLEEVKNKERQRNAANKEQRRQENREKSEQHPRGKGRRGRRHLSNHPFRP